MCKTWYIESLGKIASGAALTALVEHSMNEEKEETRIACLEQLEHHKTPGVIRAFLKALQSKDNRLVNRAGLGLSYVGDKSVIGPLIDALVTRHTFIIQKNRGRPGSTNATFQRPGSFGSTSGNGLGGGGLSVGGKAKRVTKDLFNQEVHAALVAITDGVDFSYDEKAWKHWLALQKKQNALNGRRD